MSEELNYYQSHKDEFKAYGKRYREKHKDEIKARKKRYREEHKDELKAYREEHKDYFKAYSEEHKDEIKARKIRYREEHKDELKIKQKIYDDSRKESRKTYNSNYYSSHETHCKIKNARINSYKRGLGYSPLNSSFLGSHIHHLHEESNASFCVYIPSFLHKLLPHYPKTGYGMQSINAVALSYWLIDYQFFKDG